MICNRCDKEFEITHNTKSMLCKNCLTDEVNKLLYNLLGDRVL